MLSTRFISVIIIVLSLACCWAKAQQVAGNYLIRNYTDKEYEGSSQVWSFAQDKNGILYVGNDQKVIEYNGVKWVKNDVKGAVAIRSLSSNVNGEIFVGTNSDFGLLEPAPGGELKYKSLKPSGKEEDVSTGDIWKTYFIRESREILFQSFSSLYFYKKGEITEVKSGPNTLLFSHYVNGRILVQHRQMGLMEVVNHKLVPIEGSRQLASFKIAAILPFKNGQYLICTNSNGLWVSDLKAKIIKNDTIIAQPLACHPTLLESSVYQGLRLHNGNYLIGTKLNGCYILNADGELIAHFTAQTGLLSDQVLSCFEDVHGNIWLGLDKGISKIEYGSGIRRLSGEQTQEGIINASAFLGDKLIVATNKGLFVYRERSFDANGYFENISGNNFSSWQLVKTENSEYILAATSGGLTELKLNGSKITSRIILEGDIRSITPSLKNKEMYFIGGINWVSACTYSKGNLQENEIAVELTGEVSGICEDSEGSIWLKIASHPLVKIETPVQKPALKKFDENNGLPDLIANIPVLLNNKLYILSTAGIYSFDGGSRFMPSNDLYLQKHLPKTQVWRMLADNNGGYWAKIFSPTYQDELVLIKPDKSINHSLLSRISKPSVHTLLLNKENDMLLFGGDDGMYVYKMNYSGACRKNYNTAIRFIKAAKDSMVYNGHHSDNEIRNLGYAFNNLTFYYGSSFFGGEHLTLFSYKLEGNDTAWSNLDTKTEKEYTNLAPGTYTFRVRSINAYGVIGNEDSYEITILPPWYRTWWAYTVYFLLLILTVYGIVQLSIRRLKAAKIKLEHIVSERTAEVVKQKDEILLQKVELEHQKKEITDSIQYAKKIQEAILVDKEIVRQSLPESFILYIPRDIVSGDFYWFNTVADTVSPYPVLIASADCTGHGVPGAFMSMIGSTLLNEIVNEKQIFSPDKILNQLHLEIRRSLKQDEQGSQSRDGMDVALCAINIEERKLEYSGAMRPLWIVRRENNSAPVLTEIKATKNPIGGSQTEDRRIFEKHSLLFNQGDCIYFFSDGYADQFGGSEGKKFTTKRFKDLLLSISHLPMQQQLKEVEKAYMEWLGSYEQIDDVLVIGVKF